MSDSLRPHEPQHVRPPCPSPTPRVYPNPCPLSWWCHPTISSSVVPFYSCPQSFPASGSFPMSQLFTSDCQSIGPSASASVLPMNSQGWFSLGLTGLMSLLSKGLSRVFSNTTVQRHRYWAYSSKSTVQPKMESCFQDGACSVCFFLITSQENQVRMAETKPDLTSQSSLLKCYIWR